MYNLVDIDSYTRISNTGACNTHSLFSNVCFDYIMFSIPTDYLYKNNSQLLDQFLELLFLIHLDFDLSVKKRLYTNSDMIIRLYTNSIAIIFNDSVDISGRYLTRFELKGQGCRYFESFYSDNYIEKYIELFKLINSNYGKFNRVDIAVDDFNYFTKKDIDYLIKNNHYCSNSKNVKNNSIKNNDTFISWGYSVGSDLSNFKLVIYDKVLERNFKNYDVDINLKQWLRFEYRFFSVNADKLILGILSNDYDLLTNYLLSYCLNYFVFKKENKNDMNKARWSIFPKMKKLFNNVSKIEKIKNQSNLESTLLTKKEWLKNTNRINEFVNLTLTDDELELKNLISERNGLIKLKNVDINLINITRQKKGISLLTKKDIEKNISNLTLKIELIKKEKGL